MEIPVRWFFCAPDALELPGPTAFASGNWAPSNEEWEGVGEVQGARRPWVDGTAPPWPGPPGPGFDGVKFAGTLDQFENGAYTTDPQVGGQSDGDCSTCSGVMPPTLCSDSGPWANSNLKLIITAIDNPASPPVGNVGDTYIFPNIGFGVWETQYTPIYGPSGNGGALAPGCVVFIAGNLFALIAGTVSPILGQENPWMTVDPISPTGGLVQMTWGWLPQAISNFTCSEVWKMTLQLA